VGRFLMALLDKGVLNRLLQITTKDYMTIYQFAQKYADVFGQSKAFFEPVTDLFPQDARHGGNLCFKMDISNTESRIGIMMPTIEETLEFTCKRLSEKSS
jgi:dTDP-4-dehydrorhamnose reductase